MATAVIHTTTAIIQTLKLNNHTKTHMDKSSEGEKEFVFNCRTVKEQIANTVRNWRTSMYKKTGAAIPDKTPVFASYKDLVFSGKWLPMDNRYGGLVELHHVSPDGCATDIPMTPKDFVKTVSKSDTWADKFLVQQEDGRKVPFDVLSETSYGDELRLRRNLKEDMCVSAYEMNVPFTDVKILKELKKNMAHATGLVEQYKKVLSVQKDLHEKKSMAARTALEKNEYVLLARLSTELIDQDRNVKDASDRLTKAVQDCKNEYVKCRTACPYRIFASWIEIVYKNNWNQYNMCNDEDEDEDYDDDYEDAYHNYYISINQ
jgi:hypothetical protein